MKWVRSCQTTKLLGARHAGEIFKNFDGKMRPGQEWELDVTDQNRNPLFLIHITTKRL